MKEKVIAVAAALAVVAFVFLDVNPFRMTPAENAAPRELQSELPEMEFAAPRIQLPLPDNLGTSDYSMLKQAITVWNQYREYVRRHDIEGVRRLSYKLSGACNDPAQQAECFGLMDNLYSITGELTGDYFRVVYFDSKQIVLLGDYPRLENGEINPGSVKFGLFFTRTESGEPRVLGLKYCLADAPKDDCFQADPAQRDLDRNGWWDQVETFFR